MALTKVSGPLLHGSNDNLGNYVINNITGAAATFTGNVSVGGTLTYDDVTNVDSVGVITARSGIRIGATGANTLITGNATGIGIGTDTPAGKLEIDAASTTEMIMLDVSGTNFAKIGHNSSGGVAVLDVRSEGHTRFLTNGNNERIRLGTAGQIGIAGANYGTSGQVLTSQGASSAVQWATASGRTQGSYTQASSLGSGTYTFTGIPSTAYKVVFNLYEISSASQSYMYMRVGSSSGVVSSGYKNLAGYHYYNVTDSTRSSSDARFSLFAHNWDSAVSYTHLRAHET